MKLHTLTSASRRPAKRVGRGNASGKGTTAGRGTKGQLSRGRGKVPAQFEGGQTSFIQKLPKNKGFNRVMKVRAVAISLSTLEGFDDGSEVTVAALRDRKIISGGARAAKVLGNGALSKKLTVAIPASDSARAAIEKAGGKVTYSKPEAPEGTTPRKPKAGKGKQ